MASTPEQYLAEYERECCYSLKETTKVGFLERFSSEFTFISFQTRLGFLRRDGLECNATLSCVWNERRQNTYVSIKLDMKDLLSSKEYGDECREAGYSYHITLGHFNRRELKSMRMYRLRKYFSSLRIFKMRFRSIDSVYCTAILEDCPNFLLLKSIEKAWFNKSPNRGLHISM
jgi:hypothetical protein